LRLTIVAGVTPARGLVQRHLHGRGDSGLVVPCSGAAVGALSPLLLLVAQVRQVVEQRLRVLGQRGVAVDALLLAALRTA
jgi:hypothetical protein